MKVLVTGASGFIGRYLVDALVEAEHEVVAVGRDAGQPGGNHRIAQAQTDYSETSIDPLMQGVDAVVHLAGRRMTREDDPMHLEPFLGPNVVVTECLVRAAKRAAVRHVVLASTIAVYSAADEVPFRENRIPHPLNAYGLSKLMAEQAAALCVRDSGVRLTCLRFAAVFGHGEKGTPALMKFIGEAQAKRTLSLQGNRNISVDQLYVRDAVFAIMAALEPANLGGVFNIGAGETYSIEQMATTVNEVFGNEGNLNLDASHAAEARKPGLDIDRARAVLGWTPRFDLAAGLGDFLATSGKACDR